MKYLILIFTILSLQIAIAKTNLTTVKVQGMVCAFCAQGVTKTMNSQKEVKSTHVDLDSMEVHITYHEGKKLSDAALKKIIEDSGFKFDGVIK